MPIACTFAKGEHIAQLLLLFFVMPGHSYCLRIGNFGNFANSLTASANPSVTFTSKFTKAEHPVITLEIHGKKCKVMFNTGADVFLSLLHNTSPVIGPCNNYLMIYME